MKNKTTLSAKFLRLNCNGSLTKLYSDLTNEERSIIEDSFEKKLDDDFVISYFNNHDYFWVLSTSRLLINDQTKKKTVYYSEIKSLDLKPKIENSPDQDIYIVLDGDKFQLQVEKGTWGVVFNLLKFLKSS